MDQNVKNKHAKAKVCCDAGWSIKSDTLLSHNIAYCPHCRTVTNFHETTVPQMVTRAEGSVKTTSLRIYHCDECRLFVRNEEG